MVGGSRFGRPDSARLASSDLSSTIANTSDSDRT
jgi:hypothetical protein